VESLGALDQLFYKADQYGVGSLIMGAASILAPAQTGETLDARATADHLCARLGCIPLLRKKLVQDPLRIGCVYKVDDPDFDVRSHIDVQSIASPGGYSELAQAIGELTSTPLELSKLWHWTVLEGLEGGKLAVVCRIHHALADGIGISEVLSSMYDPQPVQPESPTTNPPVSNAGPGRISLLGNAVMESSRRLYIDTPRFVIKSARPVLAALGEKLSSQIQGRGLQAADEAPYFVQATSLNTAHKSTWRKIAWRTLDLPEIKQIARELGCSVNDVGLYLYSCRSTHAVATPASREATRSAMARSA
jgi:hypothetical protein